MYENGSGRSREGAQGPRPIFVVKKQRGVQSNGNTATESLLVYTYVSSPGKESTVRPNSNPPNASFILFVFSLQLAFHDLYSVFRFVNPLTPGAFCPKRFFGHFGDFQAGYWPNE